MLKQGSHCYVLFFCNVGDFLVIFVVNVVIGCVVLYSIFLGECVSVAECNAVHYGVVAWDKRGTVRAGVYIFFYGLRNKNHQLGTGFLYIREQCREL